MKISIFRFDPDVNARPRMQDFEYTPAHDERVLLDVLLQLKRVDPSLSFRRSRREGVCGSDAMNINGCNGLACIQPLKSLPERVVLRPLPGFPVIRDLIVDMAQFFANYHAIRPYLINDEPPPDLERFSPPSNASSSMASTNASSARAAAASALRTGGIRASLSARRAFCRHTASFRTAATQPGLSGWLFSTMSTGFIDVAQS